MVQRASDHPDQALAAQAAAVQVDLQRRLAASLRRLREARRWGQEEAAWRANVTVRAYQRLESGAGANPTTSTLSRICAAFEADIRDLWEPTQEPAVARRPGRPRKERAAAEAREPREINVAKEEG